MLSGGEIESDKLVESGTEKEEKEEEPDREEGEGGGEAEELIKKSHVVVKRRPKKGRSNRHQQVRNRTITWNFYQIKTFFDFVMEQNKGYAIDKSYKL